MKKYILSLMALVIMVGMTAPARAMLYVSPFTDVASDSPYYNAVMYLKDKGIISGYSDGSFKPLQSVNRAETMKMIMGIKDYRLWDKATDAIWGGADVFDPAVFKDLDPKAWYIAYVKDAFNQGLVEGYPDKTMKPEQNVNTVEALKMLLNHTYLRIAEPEYLSMESIPYSDVDLSAWYANYVDLGWDFNLLVVKDNQIFPGRSLSRGDLAEMIYRTLMVDENGWEKFQDVSIKNVNVKGEDVMQSSDLMVAGKSVYSFYSDANRYIYPWILKVSSGKVLVNFTPTIMDSPVTYDAVTYSGVYDLVSGTYKDIAVNNSTKAVLQDISRDGKNLLVLTYDDTANKLLIIDAKTFETVKEVDVLKKDAAAISDAGDATYSPDNNYAAWSTTTYVSAENTTEAYSDMFPYKVDSSSIKILDLKTGMVKTLYTDSKKILRITGWKDNGDVTYVATDL